MPFTAAEQLPSSLLTVTLAGHTIIGFSLSSTVTANEQLTECPLPSVAVYITVVTPRLNEVPLASVLPVPVVAPVNV